MNTLLWLTKRNIKLFFKDKGLFFTSLITPAILLVLYTAFLGNVFRDSFASAFSAYITPPTDWLDGLVSGEILSSILAVSCVTVAFCSNMLMVQDKVSGVRADFTVSPLKPSVLALSYYAANLASTLLVCYAAAGLCFVYSATAGGYMSAGDCLLVLLDVTLLVLFGNALSSVINFFLRSQGQISAVGTVVSSGYGFLCGAYMPISSFGSGLRTVISCLPGTYGTSLLRRHALRGVLAAVADGGVPSEVVTALEDTLDCHLSFFGHTVSGAAMYAVVIGTTALLLVGYVLLNRTAGKTAR